MELRARGDDRFDLIRQEVKLATIVSDELRLESASLVEYDGHTLRISQNYSMFCCNIGSNTTEVRLARDRMYALQPGDHSIAITRMKANMARIALLNSLVALSTPSPDGNEFDAIVCNFADHQRKELCYRLAKFKHDSKPGKGNYYIANPSLKWRLLGGSLAEAAATLKKIGKVLAVGESISISMSP